MPRIHIIKEFIKFNKFIVGKARFLFKFEFFLPGLMYLMFEYIYFSCNKSEHTININY